MTLLVVYFHGFGSDKNSSKVELLRTGLPKARIYSFDIDIDPDIAHRNLEENINSLLLDDMHAPDEVIFVGTSLGAWWASKMSSLYGIQAILVNPSCNPRTSLRKYNVPENICAKYDDIELSRNNVYFVAANDEVICNDATMKLLTEMQAEFYVDQCADHRFGAPYFRQVINYIEDNYDNI